MNKMFSKSGVSDETPHFTYCVIRGLKFIKLLFYFEIPSNLYIFMYNYVSLFT